MGNEWQTVSGPKSKAKSKANKGQERQAGESVNGTLNEKRVTDPAGAVLAQIDADWNNAKVLSSKPTVNGIGAFDQLEVQSDTYRSLTFLHAGP